MLLKSSIILILLISIFSSNIYTLLIIAIIIIISNVILNKNLKTDIKKMKYLFYIYITTILFQLFMSQNGKVLVKIYNFYITSDGLYIIGSNFLRVFDIVLISWLINRNKIFNGKLKKYSELVDVIIELVPEIFILFKKKMKFKFFFKHILTKIKTKI